MPGRFRVSARAPRFNFAGFKADLHAVGKEQLTLATREWLKAVILKVPFWAGTARGTLRPLGRFLKVAVPNGRRSPNAPKTKRIHGTTFRLGFAAGAQYGRDFEFVEKGLRFEFNYTVNLPYLWWNSFGSPIPTPPLRNPTPWHAIQDGSAAFENYVQTEVPAAIGPVISKHLKAVVIK